MIHDEASVQAIRARAAAQIELIKSLEAKIVKTKPDLLEVARRQTEDIERIFLQDLDVDDSAPAEEARWLFFAEYMLHTWMPSLKQAEEQSASMATRESRLSVHKSDCLLRAFTKGEQPSALDSAGPRHR